MYVYACSTTIDISSFNTKILEHQNNCSAVNPQYSLKKYQNVNMVVKERAHIRIFYDLTDIDFVSYSTYLEFPLQPTPHTVIG